MCLAIDKWKHIDLQPIILDKDLYVTKILKINPSMYPFSNNWVTPYMLKPIKFIFGKVTLRAKINKSDFSYSYNTSGILEALIAKGIHSLIGPNINGIPGKSFIAKIPKGTKVYYGKDYDIVSEKLIIYKNKKKWQQLK